MLSRPCSIFMYLCFCLFGVKLLFFLLSLFLHIQICPCVTTIRDLLKSVSMIINLCFDWKLKVSNDLTMQWFSIKSNKSELLLLTLSLQFGLNQHGCMWQSTYAQTSLCHVFRGTEEMCMSAMVFTTEFSIIEMVLFLVFSLKLSSWNLRSQNTWWAFS